MTPRLPRRGGRYQAHGSHELETEVPPRGRVWATRGRATPKRPRNDGSVEVINASPGDLRRVRCDVENAPTAVRRPTVGAHSGSSTRYGRAAGRRGGKMLRPFSIQWGRSPYSKIPVGRLKTALCPSTISRRRRALPEGVQFSSPRRAWWGSDTSERPGEKSWAP